MLTSTFLVSFLAVMAAASPFPQKRDVCDVSSAKPPTLPSGLSIPSGQKPSHIALGLGVQNYTCSSAGTFTSVGAVAELFDLSCLYFPAVSGPLENAAFDAWDALPIITIQQIIAALDSSNIVLGQHYFVTNPFTGTGVSPVFDFRAASMKGNPNAFVLANKTGDVPAPTGSQDVDWLQLTGAEGSLAKTVFRLNTKAGQPPSSCKPGSPLISEKYAAIYWFYN